MNGLNVSKVPCLACGKTTLRTEEIMSTDPVTYKVHCGSCKAYGHIRRDGIAGTKYYNNLGYCHWWHTVEDGAKEY